ncbi:MAG: hypothetical protein COV74_00505 [Candidatus Omnitrophica bacterium CG11_big_fil_rev_8_21_14_0_20_45_26]|uniref:Uncharacterized protein n=1 Tax=Candidatus Abzuiibacterium crystallinum TaxID=1974748 RepID=A0A2H0LUW8_9BACT|nr:MAG: hypothetical protein COV74_00505 [Candidatus Omnitrophica bacterium CG11_big_fil_rev_8_21_14_0_20_45_26]PIW63369.1 MAG: hypothetical protein COW12_10585 [Candidatus Omnitrophica bacterium CG12_big_fil_rev_8_21_14_0_65_45_16]
MPIHGKAVTAIIKPAGLQFVLFFCISIILAGPAEASLFNDDPVKDTQTTPVAVTEETLQYEGQSGAPAPSFKMLKDTGKFFVEEPMEDSETEKTVESNDQQQPWVWPWLSHPSEDGEEDQNETAEIRPVN